MGRVYPWCIALVTGMWLADVTPVAAQSESSSTSSLVAITNVNVIPMDRERVLAAQTVIIERGIITRLGPAARISIPSGAQRFSGRGKYLIPGLADVHVHLASNPPNEQEHILSMFLVNGVTTVLNMRGTPQILDLRASIVGGHILGPRIHTVGSYVNEPFVRTPEEVATAVVEQKRSGYDFIKLHGDLSDAAYRRLMETARREGIRVIGHAPRNLGLDVMFEERQYALAHAEEFLYDRNNSSGNFTQIEPQIPQLAKSMVVAGIWLMPNFTAFRNIGEMVNDLPAMLSRPEMQFMPRSNRIGWGPETNPYTRRFPKSSYPGIMARYEMLKKLVRAFHAEGVRMLIGTDAMNTGTIPGFSMHDEMAELVGAGITPYETLRAATVHAAQFLGAASQRGMIAPGQQADLVILNANPLQDIANTRRIDAVVVRGQLLSRVDLTNIKTKLLQAGALP